MPRTTCSDNCFLPRKTKGLFLAYVSRVDLLYTVLKTILNIEKYYQDFYTCSSTIPFRLCPPCTAAHIFRNKQYVLFEDCFHFNLIHKVALQLNETLSDLQKDPRSHFICKITQERFHFKHKCFFTGRICQMDLQRAQSIWEEKKKEAIISNQPTTMLKRL